MTFALEVRVDDRLRLAGALLAASEWPEREQAAKAYKAHRIAEGARKYFAPHREHPAVQATQAIVGAGEGLGQLFRDALSGDWPSDLVARVEDFKAAAQPENYWAETQAGWQEAESDARAVLGRADLGQFLADLISPPARALALVPNLLFPGRQTLAVSSASEVLVCAPPPQAWGASPPWRYSERPDEVLATVSEAFARFLFADGLPADQAALKPHAEVFALAAAVLFLRQAEGDDAGDQFMVMEKKTRGLAKLPTLVNALEAILAERRAGKYAGLADYLSALTGHF